MPTAREFVAIAERLDDVAQWAGGPLTALAHARQGVVTGGSLTSLITRTLLEANDHLTVNARTCRAAAEVARDRAEACELYTRMMEDYRAALERCNEELAAAPYLVGSIAWPNRPARPGPWAEED